MGNPVFTRRRMFAVAAGAGAAAALGAQRPAFAGSGTNILRAGETLSANQYLRSANGSYTASMQGDGNFVLYVPGRARWSTRTGGQNGASIVMQGDGNLVMYRNGGVLWHSGTAGYNGASLVMQDDGNLVMYGGGTAIWATSWHWTWGQTRSNNPNGQRDCSWYAYERFKQFSGVYLDEGGALAYQWNETAAARGWLVLNSPVSQCVVVFERNVAGASSTNGHVGWIDYVQQRSDGPYVHVWEMNFGGGIGVEHQRWVKHQAGMSYVMAPQL